MPVAVDVADCPVCGRHTGELLPTAGVRWYWWCRLCGQRLGSCRWSGLGRYWAATCFFYPAEPFAGPAPDAVHGPALVVDVHEAWKVFEFAGGLGRMAAFQPANAPSLRRSVEVRRGAGVARGRGDVAPARRVQQLLLGWDAA